jgi:hypothetical protein
VATQPAGERAPPTAVRKPVAAADPSGIQIGDTVLVPAHSSLRTRQSTIRLQTDLGLCVVDVRGDQIGCFLNYADGDEAVAWVDKSCVTRTLQGGPNVPMRPIMSAAPSRDNRQSQAVSYTPPAPPAFVRPQPNVYGASIVTLDNQSGEPALVWLVGPTRQDVYVQHSGRSSIRRVAPGEYVLYVRYGTAGGYRYTRGDRFHVQEYGLDYSVITITLHAVPSGNYAYREISEDEFNQASR